MGFVLYMFIYYIYVCIHSQAIRVCNTEYRLLVYAMFRNLAGERGLIQQCTHMHHAQHYYQLIHKCGALTKCWVSQ